MIILERPLSLYSFYKCRACLTLHKPKKISMNHIMERRPGRRVRIDHNVGKFSMSGKLLFCKIARFCAD